MSTRRNFLKSGATAAAAAATMTVLPPALMGQSRFSRSSPVNPARYGPIIDDPAIKALIQKGVDAASTAGAQFADIRLTHTFVRKVSGNEVGRVEDDEAITVGVRTLVDGYWGFAAGPVWTGEELVRLGQSAVAQAKANTLGQVRPIAFHSVPRVENKQWIMPVKADPFEMDPAEIIDFLTSLGVFIDRQLNWGRSGQTGTFTKQDKVYGSSDGNSWTQRTYRSQGAVEFILREDGMFWGGALDLLSPAGEGWELFRDQALYDAILQEMERVEVDRRLPVVPADVGRYAAVFDAQSVTGLLSETIGAATELDRVFGYEANAGGTSYLGDPAEMFNTFKIGAPLLSVRGNRTTPGSAATVQWDDDSVIPEDFGIVTEGLLTDYATSRESAGWIQDVYARHGRAARSHGCAYAPSGVDLPLVHTPNLAMTPGDNVNTLDMLTTSLGNGVVFTKMSPSMDFQKINGLGQGTCYEVKNGKRIGIVANAGILFRTPELWQSLLAIGGPASMRRFGYGVEKGEPPQASYHSVTAVPVAVKEITLIDVLRKA